MLLFSTVMTLFFVSDFLNACSEQKETDRGKTKVAPKDVENETKEVPGNKADAVSCERL
jgi:hypothetical protein